MFMWPSIAAVLIAIVWLFASHKLAVLRAGESKELGNIKFLMAETAASGRLEERKLAMTRIAAQRNIGESAMATILATLRDGHDHDCTYCSCGLSKTMVSIEAANGSAQTKRLAIEEKMLSDGWTPPPERGVR